MVVDYPTAWILRPANLPWVGDHTIHVCCDGRGYRTVEWDGHEIVVGRRGFDPSRGEL